MLCGQGFNVRLMGCQYVWNGNVDNEEIKYDHIWKFSFRLNSWILRMLKIKKNWKIHYIRQFAKVSCGYKASRTYTELKLICFNNVTVFDFAKQKLLVICLKLFIFNWSRYHFTKSLQETIAISVSRRVGDRAKDK